MPQSTSESVRLDWSAGHFSSGKIDRLSSPSQEESQDSVRPRKKEQVSDRASFLQSKIDTLFKKFSLKKTRSDKSNEGQFLETEGQASSLARTGDPGLQAGEECAPPFVCIIQTIEASFTHEADTQDQAPPDRRAGRNAP